MHLTLCLTHDCTLRCSYCYAGRKRLERMSPEVGQAAIDFAIEESLRRKQVFDLCFFGGEPLLEFSLLQKLHHYAQVAANEAGLKMRCTLTTNATLLTLEIKIWLLRRRFYVGLSIDGNAAMHNACRLTAGGKGSHELVAPALALFKRHERCAHIIAVVDPTNVAYLAEGVRWLREQSKICMTLNVNYSAEWTDGQCDVLEAQLEQVKNYCLELYRAGCRPEISLLEGKVRTHLNGGYRDCDMCRAAETEMAVAASGNLYPCSRLVGNDERRDICFGNVLTGIDRAKQNYLIYRRGNRTLECFACELRERCMNWCFCVNDASSHYSDRVSPFSCWYERLCIRLADSMAEELYAERNPSFMQQFYSHELLES